MNPHFSESQSSEHDGTRRSQSEDCSSIGDQRKALELELIRVRCEADAARLDAQAAELELRIERLKIAETNRQVVSGWPQPTPSLPADRSDSTVHDSAANDSAAKQPAAASPRSFGNWSELETLQQSFSATLQERTEQLLLAASESDQLVGGEAKQPASDSGDTHWNDHRSDKTSSEKQFRFDAPAPPVRAPYLSDALDSTGDSDPNGENENANAVENENAADEPEAAAARFSQTAVVDDDFPVTESASESDQHPHEPPGTRSSSPLGIVVDEAVVVPVDESELELTVADSDQQVDGGRRRKPAALVVSSIIHVAVVVALAFVTFQTQKPRDQVALSATAPSASEVAMETFSIEQNQLESDTIEQETSEVEYEVSEIGEVAVERFAPPAPPTPPSFASASLSSSSNSAAELLSKSSNSDAKMQFCGVDGGGNHFVYLVDSSQSMGSAFNSARLELIKSINMLKPDQRFYVIFFDSEPDFMRITDPQQNEPRSVYATEANKAALQRWAMNIKMDRGRNPNDLLDFVFELRADAVFLLSDGEFPQSTEDKLAEKNRRSNLFGDSGPISIVHTIAYYSREGESRMTRIAQQHSGQYRFIPKP